MNVGTRMAEHIGNAVLYEGYVLYPYRASASKNRLRWQVGLVTPREYAEAVGSDPWFMQTECLVQPGSGATLSVRVRCLHVQERTVERCVDPDRDVWHQVERLTVGAREFVTWEEAVARDFVREALPLQDRVRSWHFDWTLEGGGTIETLHDDFDRAVGRVVRRTALVRSAIRVETEPAGDLLKVRLVLQNVSPCGARSLAERTTAVRQSLAGTHAILSIEYGEFVSLLEPPPAAAHAAASCRNLHTWPVLVGAPGARDVMLSSPIVLYDYPAVAPESPGDFCDATEIDEMLMLRVQTLTPDEKREARATDERAARIIDRADGASPETMSRLHGAIRRFAEAAPRPSVEIWETFLNPPDEAPPEDASLQLGSTTIVRGTRVRLKPTHRADSMDICLDGRTATVTAIHRTLEDRAYVAVIVDDDPFGAAGARYRRAFYFHPDELVPLEDAASDGQVCAEP